MPNRQRVFITGASGCIGHYLVELLMQQTEHELFLLVRHPDKLQVPWQGCANVHVLPGDLRNIYRFKDLLATMDTAILTAAAWGDPIATFDVNVSKTLELMSYLDGDRCQQVIYFSTASILDRHHRPLKQAGELGTDYIRSKYICHQRLKEVAIAPKITTVYPTLVFGGDAQKPYSHLSNGLGDVLKWLWLIRFFRVDGSFHFVHARDIAQVVAHLVDHPPKEGEGRSLVLGNPALTANQAIRELARAHRQRPYLGVPLMPFADLVIRVFRIQMAAWDRFCLRYRHFAYDDPVNPATFGYPVYCETVTDLLTAHPLLARVGSKV